MHYHPTKPLTLNKNKFAKIQLYSNPEYAKNYLQKKRIQHHENHKGEPKTAIDKII